MDFGAQFDALLKDNKIIGFIVFAHKNPNGSFTTVTSAQGVSPNDIIGGLEITKHRMLTELQKHGNI